MTTPIERVLANWTTADVLRVHAGITAKIGGGNVCPCRGHANQKNEPTLQLFPDGKWRCHGAAHVSRPSGDAIDMYQVIYDVTKKDAIDALLGTAPARVPVVARAAAVVAPPVPAELWPTWRAAKPGGEVLGAWLESRGIPAYKVEGLDLVRELVGAWPHGWSHYRRRIIAPLWSVTGDLVGIKGRYSLDAIERKEKETAPTGVHTSGAVFACSLGRAMLRGDAQPARVVIVEGMPDYITAAACWGESGIAPAVLGVANGDNSRLAARVPVGALVTMAPHADKKAQGIKIMMPIADALEARGCSVRWRADEEKPIAKDLNDVARSAGLAAVCSILSGEQ